MTTSLPQDADSHRRLVRALCDPVAFPGAPDRVQLVETHLSSVLLAGDFAYKLKKPVQFGFVDFSTPAKRRFFCEEELRLNRRTAGDLYLDLVPITGTVDAPRVGGSGDALEFAVRMHRFADGMLLDHLAREGALAAATVDRLADRIARFHADLEIVAPDAVEGTAGEIWRWTHENFVELRRYRQSTSERARIEGLADWTRREFERLRVQFLTRRIQGHVRECHGDLHLGNVVLVGTEPVPFDGIEFNPALRWIDVASDAAAPFVDLFDLGLPKSAWRFLNRYLEHNGDYAGLGPLRFYAVYRAMVKAKIARIRAEAAHPADEAPYARLVALAQALSLPQQPSLVLMHGLPVSGRSTVAAHLVEEMGAIRIRSEVERKRLFGVAATEDRAGEYGAGIYGAEGSRRTYERLLLLAGEIVDAGYPVVVDAGFSRRADRAQFIDFARRHHLGCVIVDCTAQPAVIASHAIERHRTGAEELTGAEREITWAIPTDVEPSQLAARCAALASRLDSVART
jgi:aminoglycoside phosphotransferase family enzyme/predicted kinase